MLPNDSRTVRSSTSVKIMIFKLLKKLCRRKIKPFGIGGVEYINTNLSWKLFWKQINFKDDFVCTRDFVRVKRSNTCGHGRTVIFFVSALTSNQRESRSYRETVEFFSFDIFFSQQGVSKSEYEGDLDTG